MSVYRVDVRACIMLAMNALSAVMSFPWSASVFSMVLRSSLVANVAATCPNLLLKCCWLTLNGSTPMMIPVLAISVDVH